MICILMGSLVSAVIANLHMESFEEQAIATSPYKPRVWKRYVDDTLTILDHKSVNTFSPWRQRVTAGLPSLTPQF